MLGAMPLRPRRTRRKPSHVIRTARLFESAGRHFNRGQRAFFFALGYLGWFIGPGVFMVTTALVLVRCGVASSLGRVQRRDEQNNE